MQKTCFFIFILIITTHFLSFSQSTNQSNKKEPLTLDEAKKELTKLKDQLKTGDEIWHWLAAAVSIVIGIIFLWKIPTKKVLILSSILIITGILIGLNIIRIRLPYRSNQDLYDRISYLEGFIEGNKNK